MSNAHETRAAFRRMVGSAGPVVVPGAHDPLGGMGARGKNFYNQLARRHGYEAEAVEIQDLYLARRKADAAIAVPEDLVHAVTLMGDDASLRRQLEEFSAAGARTLLVNPVASSPEDRLDHVARLASLSAERCR